MTIRPTRLATQLGIAFGSLVLMQGAALAQTLERVEITGSSIRRVDAETAQPVTIIKTEDLAKQGVTTIEQALGRLSSAQSSFATSNAVGGTTGGKSEVDMRGLGGPTNANANKTLVLLNGRRIANHPFDSAAVDLHAIPLAAVERIEVLRDGASAVYGTDAIGGVINFILKRNFVGGDVSVEIQQPQADGGGSTRRASIVGGFGTLSGNGFNVIGSLDIRKQRVLLAADRKFSQTGIIGGDVNSGTSGTSFPGDLNGFEPTITGTTACDPPNSVLNNAGTGCRYDFSRSVDALPENEQLTGLLRGTIAVGSDAKLGVEFLSARNEITAQVAPAPTSSFIPTTSPFFPAGANNATFLTAGGINDINNPITNPDGSITFPKIPGGSANWRQVPAGKRTSGNVTTTDRFLVDLDGTFSSWDYKTAIGTSTSKSTESVKLGYVDDSKIAQGVFDGIINPFGAQTDAGTAAIAAAQVSAPVMIGKSTTNFADLRVSGDLAQLPAGAVSVAFGVEVRHEKSSFEATDITAQLGSLGIDPESDTAGSRNSKAVFAELSIPATKGLDFTVAARYDRYSDFGSTFNPKLGLRFQPAKEFLIRGSVNKGFRAPTLYEIYQPASLTFTSDAYDDPTIDCADPTLSVQISGTACAQQVLQRQSGPAGLGNPVNSLKPEKSTTWSLGAVLDPAPSVTLSADLWSIKVKNLISPAPEQAVFGNPAKYASRYVRCNELRATNATLADTIDSCQNTAYNPIAYIDVPNENLGELKTSGIDLSAMWRLGSGDMGKFTTGIEGTYVYSYKYQREVGGEFINALGRYSDNAPIFKWQHVLTLNWSTQNWSVTGGQRFKSGYTDQDPVNRVESYTTYDLGATWTGIKGLSVTGTILNVLDQDPPVTNQVTTFQRGYDPRFTDPLGRTFGLRIGYKF